MTAKVVFRVKNIELLSKFVKPLIFNRDLSRFACEASNSCLISNRRSLEDKFGINRPKFVPQVCDLSTSGIGNNDGDKKLSIFQRFKLMYKEYWYVLLPVHIGTSACWLGGFYYMAIRLVQFFFWKKSIASFFLGLQWYWYLSVAGCCGRSWILGHYHAGE